MPPHGTPDPIVTPDAAMMMTWQVPFNLLNYYTGASGRFGAHHVLVAHLFTLPMCFMWTGVGGAILKYRQIDRNEVSDDLYLPFIWSGFAVTLIFLCCSTVGCLVYARRAGRSSGFGSSTNRVNSLTPGGVRPLLLSTFLPSYPPAFLPSYLPTLLPSYPPTILPSMYGRSSQASLASTQACKAAAFSNLP